MPSSRPHLSRDQILAFRRRVSHLDERLPAGKRSLRKAAVAGLQDSMPRAAVLSVNARVGGASPTMWEHDAYVQIWGPRYSAYVIPKQDVAVFTLGRQPSDPKGLRRASDTAAEIEQYLGDRSLPFGEVGRALGGHPNRLRYAATTGTVLIRWDGARQPTIWMIPAPDVDPADAQLELARRYLHIFGPSTAAGFAAWAGIRPSAASATFDRLGRSLAEVETPLGTELMLASDVDEVLGAVSQSEAVRLLPSGDTYYLLQGDARSLVVPDADKQRQLWTSRVWPGALLVGGEIVGTWRRRKHIVTATQWQRLSHRARKALEDEARSLPLPEAAEMVVEWE